MISIIEEIELINDIIDSAISHGGDAGGAYCSIGIRWKRQLVNGCLLRK